MNSREALLLAVFIADATVAALFSLSAGCGDADMPLDRYGRPPEEVARGFLAAVNASEKQKAKSFYDTESIHSIEYTDFNGNDSWNEIIWYSRFKNPEIRAKLGLGGYHRIDLREGGKTWDAVLTMNLIGGEWRLVSGGRGPPSTLAIRRQQGVTKPDPRCVRGNAGRSEGASSGLPSGQSPGDSLSIDVGNGVHLDMVWIAPGEFAMGSSTNDDERNADETEHRVLLSEGFWMARCEVTQAQWSRVMPSNPSYYVGSNLPVHVVSWNDCQDFIAGLNALTASNPAARGIVFCLPTEAEWEYACRAGTTTRFCFGDTDTNMWQYGNYCDASNTEDERSWRDQKHDDGFDKTAPVGSLRANAWGLYDMHGNVWEWCHDRYGEYPTASVTDPMGPPSGPSCVLRGGAWYTGAMVCRSARRLREYPWEPGKWYGFRVVGLRR